MLIINAYFDSCNMDATSGANALIVNESLFRGSQVIVNNLIDMKIACNDWLHAIPLLIQ